MYSVMSNINYQFIIFGSYLEMDCCHECCFLPNDLLKHISPDLLCTVTILPRHTTLTAVRLSSIPVPDSEISYKIFSSDA